MRIAVTGTHGSGKSTLIDDLIADHPGYAREDEPYWTLVQQGVQFADPPTVEDYERQLDTSVATILGLAGEPDVILDRCPLDFLGYLEVTSRGAWEPTGRLLARIEKALAVLDLLVFVPLHEPDEIRVAIELPRLRARVDRVLCGIVRDDALGFFAGGRPRLVEVRGPRAARLQHLSRAIGERGCNPGPGPRVGH